MMQRPRSLFANLSWLAAGDLLSKLLGFAATVILARRLGTGSFGDYIVASSLAGYAMLLSVAGGESLPVRLLKQRLGSTEMIVRTVVKLRFVGAVFTSAILILIPVVLPLSEDQTSILLLHAILIPGSVLNASYVLQSRERMDLLAAGRVCQALLYLMGTVFVIQGGRDVILVPVVHGIASLGFAACTLIPLWHWKCASMEAVDGIRASRVVSLVPFAAPMVASALLMTMYYSLDSVMLGMLRSSEEAGMYGAAYRIVMFLLGGGSLVYQAFMARLATPEGALRLRSQRSFILTLIVLGVGASTSLMVFAEPVLILSFGEQCRAAVPSLRILSVAVLLGLFNMAVLSPMLLHGMETRRMLILAVASLVNVGLNIVLIPRYGMTGAAWATAAAELSVAAINIPHLRRNLFARSEIEGIPESE